MGYRSEVAFCTKNLNVPNKFKKLLEASDGVFQWIDNETKDVWRGAIYESVKWYEDEFEDWCRDNAENVMFFRMGEESGDEDIIGELWDNPFDMGIHRYININQEVGEQCSINEIVLVN